MGVERNTYWTSVEKDATCIPKIPQNHKERRSSLVIFCSFSTPRSIVKLVKLSMLFSCAGIGHSQYQRSITTK